MKIAICDDDKKLRKDLRHLIEVQLDFMAFAYEIEEYESGNCILASQEGTGGVQAFGIPQLERAGDDELSEADSHFYGRFEIPSE